MLCIHVKIAEYMCMYFGMLNFYAAYLRVLPFW